jgi:hypothetical protein
MTLQDIIADIHALNEDLGQDCKGVETNDNSRVDPANTRPTDYQSP